VNQAADHAEAEAERQAIAGGTHENMVPIACEACVYVLVPTVEAEGEVLSRLLPLRPDDPDVRLEVRRGLFRPPYVKTRAIQALYDHAAALARDLPYPVAGERVAGGGSDGTFTGALGVPTLDGLGVIGAAPHTHEEHLLVGCLVPRTRLWIRLFETLTPSVVAEGQPAGSRIAI
jgi:glutamate carboxypeptidase